jgi:hypothetical protein
MLSSVSSAVSVVSILITWFKKSGWLGLPHAAGAVQTRLPDYFPGFFFNMINSYR